MSFVALPPAPSADQPPPSEALVENDGFFPSIDPADVREAARIPSNITPARLRAAIVGAMMTIGLDLQEYAERMKAGHAALADVPAQTLDGQSVQLLRYGRAVALYAKAELIERHRDFDLTAAGGNQVDDLTASIGELRRDAQHAVRDMLGRSRTVIDLI